MDAIAAWAAQLQWDVLLDLLVTAAAAVLCITFHETCHGLTALAGPVSNVFLSALAAVGYTVSIFYGILHGSAALEWVGEFCYLVFHLSAGLAVFNLLPVPPLDGSKVLFALLPEPLYWKLMRYERYGMLLMMALLLTGALDIPLHFLRDGLIDLLAPISGWTLDLLTAIHR